MTRLSRLRFIDTDRTRLPVRRRLRSRGVPNALQDHPVALTADVGEASEVTSHLLGSAVVSPVDGPRRSSFQCGLHAISFLDVTMAYLDYVVATEVVVGPAADAYTVHMTSAGQASARVEGTDHALSPFAALVVSPGMHYRMTLDDDSPQMIIRVEREALERQLSRMLGRSLPDPVVLDPVGDLTSSAFSRWHGAINILSAEVMSPASLIQRGVGAGALEELIISTLLYVQHSNYSERLTTPARRSSGRVAVLRSIDYIEQHLAEPITLDDLAAFVRMSPRSIQAGFREDLDTTPMAFIRGRRLEQVRRSLLQAMPGDGVNVTDVAQHWGFTHLGNFSVRYRQEFGESPSQTLRRPAVTADA
ncbi:MAG: AraC family transcriptional regulator [Nocardioidaceae bacterium]